MPRTKTIKAKGRKFKLSAGHCKTVRGFPHHKGDNEPRCQFDVVVEDLDSGKTESFKYHDSIHNFNKGKMHLDGEDLSEAFEAFLDDAIYGTMDFDDFVGELGYDTEYTEDYKNAKRIHRATRDALDKTSDLDIEEDELYDLINHLRELEE